jgi:hypothetical protein
MTVMIKKKKKMMMNKHILSVEREDCIILP